MNNTKDVNFEGSVMFGEGEHHDFILNYIEEVIFFQLQQHTDVSEHVFLETNKKENVGNLKRYYMSIDVPVGNEYESILSVQVDILSDYIRYVNMKDEDTLNQSEEEQKESEEEKERLENVLKEKEIAWYEVF